MHGRRRGYSLLEVMVAGAILFGAMLALVQLAGVGEAHLKKARTGSRARALCHNKLNEVISGIVPLESAEFSPFIEAPDWQYEINVQPIGVSNLVAVTVTVITAESESDAVWPVDGPKHKFRLVRWIRQPQPVSHEVTSQAELLSSADRR